MDGLINLRVLDYYCINNTSINRYVFGGMRGLVTVGIELNGDREQISILLPIHIISDERIIKSHPSYELYINTEYEAYDTIDKFYEFYKNCGWYYVNKIDNNIIISGYNENVKLCNSLPTGDTDNLDFNSKIIISFRDINNKYYFTITME